MIKLINAYTLSECLDAVAEEIDAYEQLGQKNIVFCEDRLTLVAERALMRRLGGTILTEVTTFSRFLNTTEKVLSREGSVMAVGEIMLDQQKKGRLKCFTSSSSVLTGAKCIYEQLAQFAASDISVEELKKDVEELKKDERALSKEEKGLSEDALKNKMSDLAILYEEYDRFLSENKFIDEGKYLTLLPDCIKNMPGMSETNVFFLCYSSFTKQAKKTLRSAVETARNVVGVFLAGDEAFYTKDAYKAFKGIAEEYGKKRYAFHAVNVGAPLEGDAEVLRKNLFAPEALAEDRKKERVPTDSVRIFVAGDRQTEAEYAAVYIRKHLQENPALHYRDFAVLTPSVREYSLAIRKAFTEYGIPYSVDERISLKQHPLAKFILAVMRAVTEGFTVSSVDEVAGNLFFGDGDDYRNYLTRHGNFREAVFKKINPLYADQFGGITYLDTCKKKMETAFSLFQEKRYGGEYCAAIERLFEEFSTKTVLDDLMKATDDEGMRSYLSQIEKKLNNLLDDAKLLAGGKEMSLEDFSTLFADGLDATEIAPNPLRLDAVFVGDLTDSRIERINVLFAMGLTDAVPRASDDANLITDQDKEKLKKVNAYLEPMVQEVNLRNRESLSLNLCAFTEKLYLSYPMGTNGDAPAVSDVFRYVNGAFIDEAKKDFTDEDKKNISVMKTIPEADFAYRCSALAPAIRQMLLEKNKRDQRMPYSKQLASSLKEALQQRGNLPSGVDAKVDSKKSIEKGKELLIPEGRIKPSKIEKYFECPYQFFASYGLYLEEKKEGAVLAADTGNYVHKLLALVTKHMGLYKELIKKGKMTEDVAEKNFVEKAKRIGMSLMKDEKLLPKEDTLSGVYSNEKLLEEAVEVAHVAYRQFMDSKFDTISVEHEVETADMKGNVDRIDQNDEYIRVIDYKTGAISAEIGEYYVGRKLQTELYMSAVKGDKTPVAVMYFPASVSFKAKEKEDERFRMRGFLNADQAALLCGDKTLTDKEKSRHFDASLKKSKAGHIIDGALFEDFLDYAVCVSEKAKKEMEEGHISPSPLKSSERITACTYCKYGGMCGFCEDKLAMRTIPKVNAEAIAQMAKKHREEKEEGENG